MNSVRLPDGDEHDSSNALVAFEESARDSPTDPPHRAPDDERRRALAVLRRHGGTMTLADLADEVSVRRFDAPLSEIDPQRILRVYNSLYHTHVPKLAAAGRVEYEQERDLVRLTETLSG